MTDSTHHQTEIFDFAADFRRGPLAVLERVIQLDYARNYARRGWLLKPADHPGRTPLQAYRSLPADTASPEYGLVDPEITLRVTDTDGEDHEVALGRPTFTDGGVYAERRGDPGRVYLVPRRMMDDLRSLVAGRRIDTPDDLAKKVQENTPKDDNTSWWLKQALDTGGPPPGDRP